MNTYLDCIPCFLKQALRAVRAVTHDERTAKLVVEKVSKLIPDIPFNQPPPETARLVYSIVQEITGVADPFKTYKNKSIEQALSLYEELKPVVDHSQDPLRAALKISIAGNVIDLGANPEFDLKAEMKHVMNSELSVDHYESFKRSVEKARKVLFLGDNAGETVFDRLLIETLGSVPVYAVRDAPIINDATMDNAQKSGLGEVAHIISSGYDAPGTILKKCSREFIDIFKTADIIVSKGQGNFESLSEEQTPIFFLFKVKCSVIARHAGAPEGCMILKDNQLH